MKESFTRFRAYLKTMLPMTLTMITYFSFFELTTFICGLIHDVIALAAHSVVLNFLSFMTLLRTGVVSTSVTFVGKAMSYGKVTQSQIYLRCLTWFSISSHLIISIICLCLRSYILALYTSHAQT